MINFPSLTARHGYIDVAPGCPVPLSLEINAVKPAGFSESGWQYLTCQADTSYIQGVLQLEANEVWEVLRAAFAAVSILHLVTNDPIVATEEGMLISGNSPASVITVGDCTGGGLIVSVTYNAIAFTAAMVADISLPCRLYLTNSKLTSRGGYTCYKIDRQEPDEFGSGNCDLYLHQSMNDLAWERIDPDWPVGAQLLAYTGAAKLTWPVINENSSFTDCLNHLIYGYMLVRTRETLFVEAGSSFVLSLADGHHSLSSLVAAIKPPASGRYYDKDWSLEEGYWRAAKHVSNLLVTHKGLEHLDDASCSNGPGVARIANTIDWANLPADSDSDSRNAFRGSLLRGLQSVHNHSHVISGSQAPVVFNRTWLLFKDIPDDLGLHCFYDGWVEGGYWDVLGNYLGVEGVDVAYRQKVRIVHGIQANKSKDLVNPTLVTTVTISDYLFLEDHPLGANVNAKLRLGESDFAKDMSLGYEDRVDPRRCAGLKVLARPESRFNNWANPQSVTGRGGAGTIQEGCCLRVPSTEAIPAYLRNRLIPIVAATAGTGPVDSAWDWTNFGGVMGLPADFETWGGNQDELFLANDPGDTWGELVRAGCNPIGMTFDVVRHGYLSAVHSSHSMSMPASGIIFFENYAANRAIDVTQYLEKPQPSLAGDPVVQVLENIISNGYDFTLDPAGSDGYTYTLGAYKYRPSQLPQTAFDWTEPDENGIQRMCDGAYSYGFSKAIPPAGASAVIGSDLDGEDPSQSSYCNFYNPSALFKSPRLDRCPVPAEGITAAYANATFVAPVETVVRFWPVWYEGDPGYYQWEWKDPVVTDAPLLDMALVGVADGEYATLSASSGAETVADGVQHERVITDLAQKYVANWQKYKLFGILPIPNGFSITPSAVIGPQFMLDLWRKTHSNSIVWDEYDEKQSGEAIVTKLTYDSMSIANCHVELDPDQFTLPLLARVN